MHFIFGFWTLRLRDSAFIRTLRHPIWFSLVAIVWFCDRCPATFTVDEGEINNAVARHAIVVVSAALEVSKEMAIRIDTAITSEDFERAEILSRSLASFLSKDGHPASTISVAGWTTGGSLLVDVFEL